MPTSKRCHLIALGARLRAFLGRDDVFGLLPKETWTQGGCWALGVTLAEWFGPRARLHMTVCDRHSGGDHVACEVDGVFFDGDGAQSERELLDKLATLEGCVRPRLAVFDGPTMRRSEALEPDIVRTRLLALLDDEFGRFERDRRSAQAGRRAA